MTDYQLARQFNIVSGKKVHDEPNTEINDEFRKNMVSQYQLLESEIRELEVAWGRVVKSDVEILDAICDINYILYGTLCYLGISPDDYDYNCVRVELSDNIFDEIVNIRNLINTMRGMITLEECQFDYIKIILMGINLKTTHLAKTLRYDYDQAFKIVHEANMSKFCNTVKEAKLTVEFYEKIKFNTDYKYPDYRLSPDEQYYIVYNNDTSENPMNNGKILKSINWKEPDLSVLFSQKSSLKLDNGITLIIGPMFSDKTSYLFSVYDKLILQGYSCLILKYINDNRFGSNENILITHDNKSRPALGTDDLTDFSKFQKYDALFIDEIQFFNIDFDKLVEFSKYKKVVVAGLSGDYMRKPFDNVSKLIPLASRIKHKKAICLHNGKKASFSKRLVADNTRILIGDNTIYEAVDLDNY